MTAPQRSLRLRVLGPWRAWLDDRPPLRLATRHARILLARLAVEHPQPIARTTLIRDLFGELPAESAARRLRSTRHYVRQELGDLLLVDEQGGMGLAPELRVQCDYLEFLQLAGPGASRGELVAAAELYHGRMFQSATDGWAGAVAREAHARYVGVLRSLVTLARSVGAPAESLAAAQQWVAEEPWDEQAHVAYLEALIALGSRSAAQAHLAAARSILRAEWSDGRSHALDGLARTIGRLPEDHHVPRPAPLRRRAAPAPDADAEAILADPYSFPLVGRDVELAAVRSFWDAVLAGAPGGLLIEGAGGVGKSRLAGELVRQVRLRAPHIALWCAADADHIDPARMVERSLDALPPPARAEVAQACAALDVLTWSVLCRSLPRLRQLLPSRLVLPLPELFPASEAARRTEALGALLAALAGRGALLLVLDDLPRVGEELADLLAHLLRGARRAGVIVTAPPDACRTLVDGGAAGPPRFRALPLVPLDAERTRELIAEALGPAAGTALLRQLAGLGGAPGFVIGALRTLLQQEILRYEPPAGWRLAAPALPAHAMGEAALAPRLERLSPEARDLAELLAVLGRPVGNAVLAALDPDEERRLGAQAELLRNAVLAERGDDLQFEHPWLQGFLRDGLPPERRAALHGRAADALAAADAPPEERAHHCAEAGRWDEALALALPTAEASLTESRLGVLERALEIAERALDALDVAALDERRWETLRLRERHGALLMRDPAWSRALAQLRALADAAARPDWQAEAMHRDGLALLARGRPAQARALLDRAAATARSNALPELEIWARLSLADAIDACDEPEAALHECLVAAKAAFCADNPELSLRVLIRLGEAYARAGRVETALQLLDDMQHHPLLQQRPLLAMRHAHCLGRVLFGARSYARGLALLRACLQQAYTVGDPYWKLRAQAGLAQALIALGSHADGLALAETILPLAQHIGDTRSLCELSLSQASAHLGSGALELALARAREGAAHADHHGFAGLAASHCCAGARAAAGLGRHGEAQELLSRADPYLCHLGEPAQLAAAAGVALALDAPARARAYAQLTLDRSASPGLSTPEISTALWEAARVIAAVDGAPPQIAVEAAVGRLLDDLARLDDPALRRALIAADPAHRTTAALAERGDTLRLVLLPIRHAPAGRALHPDELLPVVWTLADPADPADPIARRQQRLSRLAAEALAQGAVATVEALAAALDVTPRTIKRDLSALRARGVAVATRGALLGTGMRPAPTDHDRRRAVSEMSP